MNRVDPNKSQRPGPVSIDEAIDAFHDPLSWVIAAELEERVRKFGIATPDGYAQLLGFARDILGHWPDGGDLDGGDIQGLAIKHGLLVGTVVHEPCNGGDPDKPCRCAEFCAESEFTDGVKCYRPTSIMTGNTGNKTEGEA